MKLMGRNTRSKEQKHRKHKTRGNLKLDESCISNPKSEIANWTHELQDVSVQFQISDFGFEMQDSSNFKFPLALCFLCSFPFFYDRTPATNTAGIGSSLLCSSTRWRISIRIASSTSGFCARRSAAFRTEPWRMTSKRASGELSRHT